MSPSAGRLAAENHGRDAEHGAEYQRGAHAESQLLEREPHGAQHDGGGEEEGQPHHEQEEEVVRSGAPGPRERG